MANSNTNGNGYQRRWYDLYAKLASALLAIVAILLGWWMNQTNAKVEDVEKVNAVQNVQIKETQTDIKYIKQQQEKIYTRQETQMDKMDQIILQTKDR